MINSVIEVAVQHGFTHASVLHLINVLVVALLINVLLGFICVCPSTFQKIYHVHSNLDIANKSIIPFLFTISNNSLYQM